MDSAASFAFTVAAQVKGILRAKVASAEGHFDPIDLDRHFGRLSGPAEAEGGLRSCFARTTGNLGPKC